MGAPKAAVPSENTSSNLHIGVPESAAPTDVAASEGLPTPHGAHDAPSPSATPVPFQDPGVQSFPGAPTETDQSEDSVTTSLSPTGSQPPGIFVGSVAMPKLVESEPSDNSESSAPPYDGDNEGSPPGPSTLATSTISPTPVSTDGAYATGETVLRIRNTKSSASGSFQLNSAFIYLLALGMSTFIVL